MPLTVQQGAPVTFRIQGHSALNGAPIPDTAKIALTSNDPTVATVPATVPVPAGGAQEVDVPVDASVGTGSTDISGTITLPDGTVFQFSDSLIVGAVVPGLTHVTGTLTSP
jgi:hypothetical protein